MESFFLQKIIDMFKQVLLFKKNPSIICQQSRISCEAILREVYKRETGELPEKLMFDGLMKAVIKQNPQCIPLKIQALFTTVQIYGNMASHPQDNLDQLDQAHAEMMEKAIGAIFNWFVNDYYKMDVQIQSIFGEEATKNDNYLQNYQDLLMGALADKKLELDEYESLLHARINLQISESDALMLERDVCQKVLGRQINNLNEILECVELRDFQKYERSIEHVNWHFQAVKSIQESENIEWKYYVGQYLPQVKLEEYPIAESITNVIGSWQGWYFQRESKTYFTLFFVAKNDREIIGVSMEPSNPEWKRNSSDHPLLHASIEGGYSDDLLFNFKKTYLFEGGWSIDYQGIVVENGKSFEGEWSIRSLNGPFNALKSKSLMPVRIFNTTCQLPIVPTIYLDQFKLLTGTYLIQLQGRNCHYYILHLLQISNQIHVNLIAGQNDRIVFRYAVTDYSESSRISFNVPGWEHESICMFNISFDFNNKTISGVVKDEVNKMRALKGTLL